MNLVAQGWGKTVVLGVDGSAAPISVPSFDIMRGRSVTGSLFGGIKPKDDIPMLAQKYLDKVTPSPSVRWCRICELSSIDARMPEGITTCMVVADFFPRSWSWTSSSRTRWASTR